MKKKMMMWHSKCRVSSPFHPSVYTSRDLQKVFPMLSSYIVYLKIWFDILTPKQVMFFRRAANLLHNSGHEVLCTSRKYREAVELARIKKLDLTFVGSHGGADRYNKLREGARRTYDLAEVVNQFEPDVAVTFSSPEGSRVAFGLGIRHIGFNDSPHAEAVAKLTMPLTSKLYCPWVIPHSAWSGYGIAKKNIVHYRALDPAAWLKHHDDDIPEGKQDKKRMILLRLEESKASYIADKKISTTKMIDNFVDELWHSANILVLCRYEDQIAEVESRYGNKVQVLRDVVDGTALIKSIQLFVGAGGTMTAEAALLGKPTISIAPIRFYVEKYLVRSGLVKRAINSMSLVRLGTKMISDERYIQMQKKRAARILGRMEDPTERMISALRL
jgi:predicted glycosyltransferase